jgi:hypothetical protein
MCLHGPNLSSIQRSTMILKFEPAAGAIGRLREPGGLGVLICFVETYVTVFAAMLHVETGSLDEMI